MRFSTSSIRRPTAVRRLLHIGSLRLPSSVILSPLERISDVGFRRLCWDQGAGLTWTEMVKASDLVCPVGSPHIDLASARSSPRGGRGANLIDTHDASVLTGVQLLVDKTKASDKYGVDILRAALEQLEEGATKDRPEWRNICAIDLNFGCPAPDVSRRGAGPAQLRRRSKIRALFEVLSEWRHSTSLSIGAVGAKIRLGNNERERNYKVYLPVTEAAVGLLDYLVVHARHGDQRSRDPPTWEAVAEVKQTALTAAAMANVPPSALKIIGNGDVRTAADVACIKRLSGCDGVMVGRAAMRNPWILRSLAAVEESCTKSTCHASANAPAGKATESSKLDGLSTSAAHSDVSEWPTPAVLEQAARENEARSEGLPAAARYRRFRQENFERLRREAVRAHGNTDLLGLSGAEWNAGKEQTGDLGLSRDTHIPVHSDWYEQWSAASSLRRHLQRLDDEAMRSPDGKGSGADLMASRGTSRTHTRANKKLRNDEMDIEGRL